MTFVGIYFALSSFKNYFPYPDESLRGIDPLFETNINKVWLLHSIFALGLTFFGALLIQYNGDKFVDLPARHL